MRARRASVRVLSFLLVLCMVIGLMPMGVFAAEADDTLTASLDEAKTYIDALTINNSSNDPATVVSNFGTHFTWDNEKRENSKSYLFDWSYYNGVVFEGIEYVYEVTGEEEYKDYVVEYMSSLINANGGWATCSNNSSKQCAGYNSTHGADCYKTASLLLDAYEMTGDSRYLTMAATLYADLDSAAKSYSLSNAGNNYRHTWASDPSPDLWLDGLYMILPFRAEYAKYIGDTEELDLIVDRMQWVSDNMYNSSKGLFYHAADSASSNSGTYWLRSIGWYAAAIVDVMDSMEGENLEAMKKQLVKLVDGMKAVQNASNGMWLNNMNASQSSSNPYETSGTALVCYAVMKAVNNGWLDESYADMAILAFNGICSEKLENNNLADICFKGTPGSSNSTFYDNEGKGVGPFIMLYAEILEYYNSALVSISVTAPAKTEYEVGEELDLTGLTVTATTRGGKTVTVTGYEVSDVDMTTSGTKDVTVTYGDLNDSFQVNVSEPEVPETTAPEVTEPEVVTKEDPDTGVTVSSQGITGLTVAPKAATESVGETGKTIAETVAEVLVSENLVVYDITVADFTEGSTATVTVPVPEGVDVNKFAVYYVADDGSVEKMPGAPVDETTYEFTTTHFSVYVGGEVMPLAEGDSNSVSGTGNLVGNTTYTIETNNVDAGEKYLILNTRSNGNGYALTNNNGTVGSTTVQITGNNNNSRTITVADDSKIAWVFSSSTSGTVSNNGRYLYPNNNSLSLNENGTNLNVGGPSNGAYQIYRSTGTSWNSDDYYLRYNSGWTGDDESRNVYLYRLTSSSAGEEVTFTVTPGSSILKPEDTATLTGTVTVGGKTVDLSDCTITWASADEDVATVKNNGTVTAVADGTANITATLSAVDGTALQRNIVLTIPVTVQSKAVTSATLYGNDPVTTKQNVEPDFSNIKLEVVYEDGTTATITTDNGLVIEGYDITTIGYSYATISYGGKEYGTVRVTVEGNPYEGKDEATEYPEYPEDGAVRIDKTATEIDFENTGVVNVELDVAGVSVKSAVDVILVTDLSNSMAWTEGTRTDATTHEDTKLYGLQQSVSSFADIFLAASEDGSETENTMTLVTFGGYDADYTDSVDNGYADVTQTLLLGSDSAETVKNSINNIRLLADSDYSGGYRLSFDGGQTYSGNYGNTNYDYAFMETAAAIAALKAAYEEETGTAYDASSRQIYILFMTDGAPSNYDGIYYRYQTDTARPDVNATWINASGDEVNYTMGNNRADYSNAAWFQYIAGGTYDASTATIPGNPLYWADQVYNTTGVADIFSVGFDLDNGGFSSYTFTLADGRPLSKVLENLVTDETLEVYSADNQTGLSQIYSELATKIRYAGTQAQATDVIGSEFTLQLTQTTGTASATQHGDLGFKPTITIKAYDLHPKGSTDTVTNEDGTTTIVDITGERTGTVTDIETVSFSDDGTKAYSNLVENGTKNIMSTASDGTVTIEAHYFTYTKTPEGVETFKWNIGNITDKEIALSFYAYLKGSLEGTESKGLKYTNEEAIVEYIDINGDYASKTFPVPAVAWGGASTAYEFYLVNANGEPCDRNGNVIPFANRVIITGPYYEELYLNQADEYVSKDIVAAKVLPVGYTLYDPTAQYTVVTASGTLKGSLTISDPAEGKNQTTILVSATTPTYVQSRVAFGVLYNLIPDVVDFEMTPDEVVIDYGKSILIDITNDDQDLINTERNFNSILVGFAKYYDNVDMNTTFTDMAFLEEYDAQYGDFSISDAEECIVKYTPTGMVNGIEQIFCVIKVVNNTNKDDWFYMVDKLTVIPATIVYYETDFADGVFTTYQGGVEAEWTLANVAGDSESTNDGVQNDGTVGQNPVQTYGYDSTYTDDAYLSDGDSWFVEGQGYDTANGNAPKTYTTFSFTGTGFDLISRTGPDQGLIKVEVFSDAEMTTAVKTVSVLNKSESGLELYQIPVVSINNLTHGTYYVRVSVDQKYESTIPALAALNRGNEFYFDAIRIYDPAKGDSVAEAAYADDGEANNKIDEVRALLLAADTFDALKSGDSAYGMVFIDCPEPVYDENGNVTGESGSVEIADYKTIGPNNEVYLAKGQAIAFQITANSVPASIDVGAKSITDAAAQLSAVVTDSATGNTPVTANIASSTVQYINLMNDAAKTAMSDKTAYVIITNTGDGVLSITDIKVAYGNSASPAADDGIMLTSLEEEGTEAYDPYTVSYTVDAGTFALARMVLSAPEAPEEEIPDDTNPSEPTEPETEPSEPETEPSEPETEPTEPETEPSEPETEPTEPETEPTEPEEEPNYDILSASMKTTSSWFLRKTTITVTTTQDVVRLRVTQWSLPVVYSSMTYVDQADGTRVWTIVVPGLTILGNSTYTVTGYGADGTRGAPATVGGYNR